MSEIRPSIFQYSDYRAFVRDLLKTYPKKGHGQFRKLSEALKTNTVTISQIFKGKRDLTVDQAYETAIFFGLKDAEEECFLLLVELSRSYLPRYRARLEEKLKAMRRDAQDLKKSLPPIQEISNEAKARFYSDWRYSAIRILCSIPKYQDPAKISALLNIPSAQLMEHFEFLMKYDLVKRKSGKYILGAASTYLDAGSPFVQHRQMTWRLKAHEFMQSQSGKTKNLFFTGPCSISENNFETFREELNQVVKKFVAKLESEPPEQLACFNIDFFRMS